MLISWRHRNEKERSVMRMLERGFANSWVVTAHDYARINLARRRAWRT